MQSSTWAPEHSQALREYLAKGMSYSEIADAINSRFGTAYTRCATIGRGRRLGLAPPPDRPEDGPKRLPKAKTPRLRAPKLTAPRSKAPSLEAPSLEAPSLEATSPQKLHERTSAELSPPPAALERTEAVTLRCVGITPRLLSLVELEPGDCRYPYGGDKDGEAITFCGHPRLAGSSYCTPHFQLTRGTGTQSERAAGPVLLRLVEAA
jgi:GcrA cell cycle regulator